MHLVYIAIIAGFIATTGMTILLWLIDKTDLANTNMVRAVGSAVTRSYKTSLIPGFIIQFSLGVLFAIAYIYIIQQFQISDTLSLAFTGGLIGLGHGFAFSFIMVILAEHHPVEKFQNASFQVAIAHFFAHIVYGFLIGLIFAVMT